MLDTTSQQALATKLIALRHNLLEIKGQRYEIINLIDDFIFKLRKQPNFVEYQTWHILRGTALANQPCKKFDFPGDLSVEELLFSLEKKV